MTPCRIRVLFRDVIGRLAVCVILLATAAAQQQATPEQQEAQREAMKKFAFLVGKWSGESRWLTKTGFLDLIYTEDARYEQNGLTLRIDGHGKNKWDGKQMIGAVTIISYDPQSGTYRIHNHPGQLEGKLTIDDDWKGMTIEFARPGLTTRSVMRLKEDGYWTETHWVTATPDPPKIFLDVAVRREKQLRPKETKPRGTEPAK